MKNNNVTKIDTLIKIILRAFKITKDYKQWHIAQDVTNNKYIMFATKISILADEYHIKYNNTKMLHPELLQKDTEYLVCSMSPDNDIKYIERNEVLSYLLR